MFYGAERQHTRIRCKLGIGITLDSITNRLSFSSDEARERLLRAAEEAEEDIQEVTI